jgi:AbiJ N-terminal domain 4
MASDSKPYVPFSQRTGLEAIPPQLKLGEVSAELRRLLYYYISLEFDRESYVPPYADLRVFTDKWRRVAMDLHVLFLSQPIDKFNYRPYENKQHLHVVVQSANIGRLFDLVEFLVRHLGCSDELKRELAEAFVTARAAYRLLDNKYIAAIGTEEQAATFERAIADAEAKNAIAARKQLIAAGVALRNSDWAGSVRESIHAVEAMAVRLAPGTDTLGAALKVLEQRGHLHGGLKAAFGSLYGYSSDEEGVRHALVFGDEAKVDEADALFMLGACASFVSYLLARGT